MLNYNSYIREQYRNLQEKVWKPNMGDLAEPILACGVAAKFANPDAIVTRTAIEKLLRKVIKKNPENIDGKPGGELKVKDNIFLRVAIRRREWEWLKDESHWELIDWQFKAVAQYCNDKSRSVQGKIDLMQGKGRRLHLIAKAYMLNGRKDEIRVDADGTGDQKGTKADIKITLNGKKANMQMSLKVKGGDQIGQKAGVPFDRQYEIFKELGIDVGPARKEYDEAVKEIDLGFYFLDRAEVSKGKDDKRLPKAIEMQKQLREANSKSYRLAAKICKAKMDAGDEKFVGKLAEFLINYGSLGDKQIEIITLTTKGFKKAKFGRNFKKQLLEYYPKLKVIFNMDDGDPSIEFYDPEIGDRSSTEARLFRIRGKTLYESKTKKIDGKTKKIFPLYVRNLVEAGGLLYKLAVDS
tara:strand:- start:936 stop:2165 length:1230 start_codon:yes stop_codon:yes gene_type:complete